MTGLPVVAIVVRNSCDVTLPIWWPSVHPVCQKDIM